MGGVTQQQRMRILLPTPPPSDEQQSPTFSLDRALAGVTVGLRLDESWQSYFVVLDEWERRLRADGAVPIRLITGDRVGLHAGKTRSDLEDWSRLVECGVIGLGN